MLEAELCQVRFLYALARKVYEAGSESKFEKLREVLRDPAYRQRMILFTEPRDTLHSQVQRLVRRVSSQSRSQSIGNVEWLEVIIERFLSFNLSREANPSATYSQSGLSLTTLRFNLSREASPSATK